MDNEEWQRQVAKDGMVLSAAITEAREYLSHDADAGNALALAVSIAIPPDQLEAFIASLRTFSAGRQRAAN